MPVPVSLPPGFIGPDSPSAGGGPGVLGPLGGLLQLADDLLQPGGLPGLPSLPSLPPLPPPSQWFPPAGTPGGGPLPVPNSLGPWVWFDPTMGPTTPGTPPPVTIPDEWGGPNSRPQGPTVMPPGVEVWPSGDYKPGASHLWTWTVRGTFYLEGNPNLGSYQERSVSVSTGPGEFAWMGKIGDYGTPPFELYQDGHIRVGGTFGGGSFTTAAFLRSLNFDRGASITSTVTVTTPGGGGSPWPSLTPAVPDGWAPPFTFPATPAAEPMVQPLPQPSPVRRPALPQAPPVTVPGTAPTTPAPAPAAVPATRPAITPLPAPAPAGGVTVTRGGVLPAPAPAPVPQTAPGTKVITGPAGPVTITPAPVPETLRGIAAEVGRIETKVALSLARPDPEPVDLSGLEELLQQLVPGQTVEVAGVTYQLRPPCGRAPGGGPLPPVEVAVPAAADAMQAILLRLDALAVLIDEQKQLRQPICKGKPAGEPVTVTFEQIG